MYFYRIEARVTSLEISAEQDDEYQRHAKALRIKHQSIHRQNDKNGTIFVSSVAKDNKIIMGAIARDSVWLKNNYKGFQVASEIDCCDTTVEEVTFGEFKALLYNGETDGFTSKYTRESILIHFKLNELCGRQNIKYNEFILQKPLSKKKLFKMARDLRCADTIIPELERIYMPSRESVVGHPVHYFIQCDNDHICDNIYELLISALCANNRLGTRRYTVVSMNERDFDKGECHALFEACTDGALIIKCGEKINGELTPEERLLRAIFGEKYEGDFDDDESNTYWLSTVCRTALEYRDRTLTIFCMPRTSERVKVKMREQLDIMTLVDLTETFVSRESAKLFLKQTAHNRKVTADKSLYSAIDSEQTTFSSTELLRGFDVWYSKRLKSYSYPQYTSFATSGQISTKSSYSGDAFSELEQLIGLDEAKTVIKQALDYFRAQRLLCDRGLSNYRPSMHMIFTGSPGTAKTTVARLFARIMRENELLSAGKLYEVGRADLVGKYVGWTAQKVKSKFSEAMGSVLFIDEAYSLVDDRDGCYGDEAISTIVSEMENRRDDIVVIFAGYSEKMEAFIRKNPGLRSRISFHVPFADYSPSELYQILEHIASKQSLILDDGVQGKVMPILSNARSDPDFGNGRYVRNLIERARMKQAGRLLGMDIDTLTTDQATRLISDDFEAPVSAQVSVKRIGFDVA